MTCVISHRDGYSEETTLTAGNDESGNKNSIQAIGSAATYLQRYTLKLALGLSAAKDDDGRGSEGEPVISEKQVADLKALAEEVRANVPMFLRYMKIKSLDELPAKRYTEAVRELEKKRKQQ